ncbi:alpha beta-hydrolase [Coniophora puteana RWD-64-598 SS2]|uniref:Alpha beta-hydrolase n=1 Tax=Coniophora puteana (strain RWD-64-598) TaxID=741705 RepID=A0A5M3M5T4_CONPW|nr:alpha beta-hydrolase [Coniophora puteana RWD-64-598 SS2]EIW74739.1 alpha beta-hydrolase [Coniophora puteana RWD-64-598 SS2]
MAYTPVVKQLKSTDGNDIYAEAVGDPSKPAVVLVHGFMLSAGAFDNLFADQKLLDKLYLIRYDVRGQGRSGKPADAEGHASSLYAADFKTVLDAFGVKKAVYCGWSLGGNGAADICTHLDPNPLTGIVFMCALPYIDPGLIAACGTETLGGLLGGVMADEQVAPAMDTRLRFVETLFKDHTSIPWDVKFAWLGAGCYMKPADCRNAVGRAQDGTKMLEAGKNGLPALAVVAADDEQVKGEETAKAMQPHFKNFTVARIANSGHAVHIDQQDEFVKVLLSFVQDKCVN